MSKHKTRLTVIAGATMALVIAGTAAVSAAPRDRDERGFGWADQGRMGQMGDPGMPGMGGWMHGGFRGAFDDFERREVTLQTADSVTSQRVEQGMVDAAAVDSLSFTLGSGEAVTVVLDEDTQVVGFAEQTVERRGWSRTVLVPTELEATEVEAGAQVVVWSMSEDEGDFIASRVVVRPADEAADANDTEADDTVAEVEEIAEEAAEEAAATDA